MNVDFSEIDEKQIGHNITHFFVGFLAGFFVDIQNVSGAHNDCSFIINHFDVFFMWKILWTNQQIFIAILLFQACEEKKIKIFCEI